MSALNKAETEALGGALKVFTTMDSVLKRLKKGETLPESELDWLISVNKQANDAVRTVKTMKGYYPK